MNKYVVLMKATGQHDQIAVDELTLEKMQELVGGWITTVPTVFPPIIVICDEEGLLKRKQPNRLASKLIPDHFGVLVGDILFAKVDGEDIVPLTDNDILKVRIL